MTEENNSVDDASSATPISLEDKVESLLREVSSLISRIDVAIAEGGEGNGGDEEENWLTEEQLQFKHQAEWNDFVWEERKKEMSRFGPIRIWLTEDVDEHMNETIVKKIRRAADFPERPIEIYISTFGGSVYAAISICDAILAVPNHVKTIGIGKIMSAGGPILCVGDERVMTENSFLMIHDINGGSFGSPSEMLAELEHIRQLKTSMASYFERFSKLKQEEVGKMFDDKKNYYFSAQEALEMGIVDRIESQTKEHKRKKLEEQQNPKKKVKIKKGAR